MALVPCPKADAARRSRQGNGNGNASKLIMVQTAVETTDEVWRLWSAPVEQFGQG
jgi:hypothetical protein